MASFTITVPDAIVGRVINGLSIGQGYNEIIPDPLDPHEVIPNPQSKAVFAKQQIKNIIRAIVMAYEVQIDSAAAAKNAESAVTVLTDDIKVD